MTIAIITIHVTVCALLIAIILIQRGRGSGLAETFTGVESMFGTKTSAFLSRTTTVLSILFFITCLSLAVLSIRQSRSLMKKVKPQPVTAEQATPATPESTPKAEETAAPQPAQEAPKTE
jgi:preprotein translocase subunit SecG